MFQQSLCQRVQFVPVGIQQILSLFLLFTDDPTDFVVYDLGCFFAEILMFCYLSSQKRMCFSLAEGHRTEFVAHAPLANHAAGQGGGLLEIVSCAGGEIIENEFFCCSPAQHHSYAVEKIAAAQIVTILFGQLLCSSQSTAARDDADFFQGVRLGRQLGHERMPRFVVGDDFFVRLAHDIFPLYAQADLIQGSVEILGLHLIFLLSAGIKGCLVDQILEVSAGKANGHCRHGFKIDIIGQGHVFRVDLEDLLPRFLARTIESYSPVKSPRSDKSGIENVRTIGGRHDDHRFLW